MGTPKKLYLTGRNAEHVKTLNMIFRLNRRLKFMSERLGLSYKANCRIDSVDLGGPRVEESGTYEYPTTLEVKIEGYPTTLEVKIEGYSNYFFSVRIVDGRWIPEGRTLSGPGLSIGQVYRGVAKELREHAAALARERQTFEPTGERAVNVFCGAKLGGEKLVIGCGAEPDPINGHAEFSYKIDGYNGGLVSTVHLCRRCARFLKAKGGSNGKS